MGKESCTICMGYKIPELVKHEKIKARRLSYDSQMYLLMLGQFLHVLSLNEFVDISKIYIKFKSRASCSYSRFVAFIRAITWLKKDLMQSLWFYGIAMDKRGKIASRSHDRFN